MTFSIKRWTFLECEIITLHAATNSASVCKSTITNKAYANMKAGFPKNKKKKTKA